MDHTSEERTQMTVVYYYRAGRHNKVGGGLVDVQADRGRLAE